MTKETLKQILVSIFVGACVAFVSSLFDGIIALLKGQGNNIAGSVVAMGTYKSLAKVI